MKMMIYWFIYEIITKNHIENLEKLGSLIESCFLIKQLENKGIEVLLISICALINKQHIRTVT